MSERVVKGELVEDLLPGVRAVELDAGVGEGGQGLGEAAADKGEDRRGAGALVHADEQAPVGEHAVGMREGIRGDGLDEAEALVELHGAAHVLDGEAHFVERAEQRQRRGWHQAEAPRAAARLPCPVCVHAWQCCAISSVRQRAWLARAFRAGTYS